MACCALTCVIPPNLKQINGFSSSETTADADISVAYSNILSYSDPNCRYQLYLRLLQTDWYSHKIILGLNEAAWYRGSSCHWWAEPYTPHVVKQDLTQVLLSAIHSCCCYFNSNYYRYYYCYYYTTATTTTWCYTTSLVLQVIIQAPAAHHTPVLTSMLVQLQSRCFHCSLYTANTCQLCGFRWW